MHHGEACALYLQTNQNVSRAGFESVVLIAQLVRAEAHVWLSTCQLELNTGRWLESSSRHIFQFEKPQTIILYFENRNVKPYLKINSFNTFCH